MRTIPVFIPLVAMLVLSAACRSKGEVVDNWSSAATPAVPVPPGVAMKVQGEADSLFLRLERTPCFGTCPTYVMRVYHDGAAVYEGRRFVEREGTYTAKLSPAEMDSLLQEASRAGFFNMQDRYDAEVTDLPSSVIEIHNGNLRKKVVGRVGAPQEFKDLLRYAEDLLQGMQWVQVQEAKP